MKKNKVVKLEDLTWKQIDQLERDKTILFQPISPLEEHGPHLPVGTDLFTSKEAAKKAAEKILKEKTELHCVLMPALPIGSCDFAEDFPGSIHTPSRTVKKVVYHTAASMAKHGFKYMMICTYHMGMMHLKGIYSAMDKIESKFNMLMCEPWGPYFHNNLVEKNEPKLGFDTSKEVHAGFRETSLMKYQYPYLIDSGYKDLQSIYRDLSSLRALGKSFKELGLKEGYVGSPARADADYGRWFFNETVKTYVNAAIDLYNGEKPPELPKNIKRAMKALFWK
ncbi:MAG: creatininase family protein [Candidatus Thermoplasmatota archaeon]